MLRRRRWGIAALLAGIACLLLSLGTFAQQVPGEYDEVLKYLGRQGDYKDQVLKVNVPRSDLKIAIAGGAAPTAFGFSGWVAMSKGAGGLEVMMGDLVLLQEEVNPVMSALLDNGLDVTALHNHFFWEEPRIFFLHIHGRGKAMDLGRRVKPALDLVGRVAPDAARSSVSAEKAAGALDTRKSLRSSARRANSWARFIKSPSGGKT